MAAGQRAVIVDECDAAGVDFARRGSGDAGDGLVNVARQAEPARKIGACPTWQKSQRRSPAAFGAQLQQTVGGFAAGAVTAGGDDQIATVRRKRHRKVLAIAGILRLANFPAVEMSGERGLQH